MAIPIPGLVSGENLTQEQLIGHIMSMIDDKLKPFNSLLAVSTLKAMYGHGGNLIVLNDEENGFEYVLNSGGDVRVAVDDGATPDYLGTAYNDGALRTSTPLSKTDGGNYITLGVDELVGDAGMGGTKGIAPAPVAGDAANRKMLCATGSWEPLTLAVHHYTDDTTLTTDQSGSLITNLGAAGTISVTLPQANATGCVYFFAVMTAQALRIRPGTAGGIYWNGSKQADDTYIWADDEGESIMLVGDGNGDWASLFTTGTWTLEV